MSARIMVVRKIECVAQFDFLVTIIIKKDLDDNEGKKKIIEEKAAEIMKTGVKFKDACHVASAIYAGCGYLISTDKRLLKYQSKEIKLVTSIEFVVEMEED